MKRTVRLAVLFFAMLALLGTPAAIADPPALQVTDSTVEATGPDGAAVGYTVTATDDNGPPEIVCVPASDSTFPLGVTTVTCVATDPTDGGQTTQTFTVTVRDTTAPSISNVPGGLTAEATGPGGAPVTFSGPSANDAVSGSLSPTCNHPSGSTFPLGTTTVQCTATDGSGNSASASFTVAVRDTRPPTLTVPGAKTAEATGPSGAGVGFSGLSASDAVSGSLTPSCSHASGSTFPLGTTGVQCSATDGAGNSATGSFTVTVRDTTAPVVTVPGGKTVEASGPSGAAVTYSGVSASDAVSGSLTPSCNRASGSTFPLGATAVQCSATDGAGNSASASFTIAVKDTIAPAVTVPGGKTVEATGPPGAAVAYSGVSATDTVGGSLTPSCSPSSGSTFPLGTTTVTCTARDPSGNSASKSFTVTVKDTTRPVIAVPSGKTAEATGPSGADVSFSASGTDTVSGNLSARCEPESGDRFPLGTTTVTCTAKDGSGNRASGSFGVTVRDTKAPVIKVASAITAEATSPAGAAVKYSGVSATDTVSGNLNPTCDPPSGSTFPLGSSSVKCTAKDGSGNTASGTFTVTVKDSAPPAFTNAPGDIVSEANSSHGSYVSFAAPTAVDVVEGPVPTSCTPKSGSLFALGATRVSCSASDRGGNSGTASLLVTVADTRGPVLTAPAPITVSSAGAETLAATASSIASFLTSAVASDLVDGKLPVTHDAPATFPVGPTTVTFSARDKSGNPTTLPSRITVVKEAVAPTKPLDRTPPENVRGLTAKPGDRAVTLRWKPPADRDFKLVVISRSTRTAPIETPVYRGPAKRFVDKRLTNGAEYRYVVVSYDQVGNRSAGVAIAAAPKADMLLSPADGARVKAPPMLRWVGVPGANYYNVQLFRGQSTVKIMSVWPVANRVQLRRTWTFGGRRQRLGPGVYRWLVWPGFGLPGAKKYGPLLGFSTFTVVAGKK